jgi:transposase-like protein
MTNKEPKTLQEAMIYFADKQNAHDFIVSLRWSDGVVCPHCGGSEQWFIKTRLIWRCKACRKQFSVKVGTIFEDSPLGLDKWLCAIWMIANAKNGISSYEIGRALGMTQKSAWFVLHRIRYAMQEGSIEKLSGDVEADETYIGGKAENMHKWKRDAMGLQGRGTVGKAIVFGLLERTTGDKSSRAKTKVVQNTKKKTLQPEIRNSVEKESNLYTDALKSYQGMEEEYIHQAVDHATEYVCGTVHTNGIENYWSLFKRTLRGTYVGCEADHLPSYLDEQTFRFNNRVLTDGERFNMVLGSVAGKRLTYKQLIIKKTFKQLNFFRKLN